MKVIELRWGGEGFVALHEKALWWPRRRALCVADVHLGKAATFRRAGIPVPESTTAETLDRLARLVTRLAPERLVILGDLLHHRDSHAPEVCGAFEQWRAAHRALDVLLVRGNHDISAGDPPAGWCIRVEDEPFADVGDSLIAFAHRPRVAREGVHTLCGHIHPAIAVSGAMHGLRAPCFWFSERCAVLPAFGAFTGWRVVDPEVGDRVVAVGDDEAVEVGPSVSQHVIGE